MTFRSVTEALSYRAEKDPEREFVKAGRDWLTYAQVDDRVRHLAAGLAARGVVKGDRVAIIAATREEVVEVFLACARIGAVFVPLNIYLKGDFLRHQLADSRAALLVVDAAGAAAAADVLDATSVREVVHLDGLPESDAVGPIASTFADVCGRGSADRALELDVDAVTLRRGDLASIIFTSGTTGRSKGCLLSHGYYLSAALPYLDVGWLRPGDRIFTALPLFHLAAQNLLMKALVVDDVSACFEPTFSASAFIDRCREERATMSWGMGPMGMMILAQPETQERPRHPMRLSVWMAMHPAAQQEYERRFGTPVTGEGYGQTECSPVALATVGDDAARGTMGRACQGMEVRLVDEEDVEVDDGEVGELVVRPRDPDTMYSGYANNATATVDTWRNLWHHTGDYARRDSRGYLVYADRKKDSLRRRGENVSSFELEQAIVKQDSRVLYAAVTAVPSALGEDDIKATLVLRPGVQRLSPADLFEIFRLALPYFAVPRYVEVRDALPTTPTGRIQKHLLRAQGVTDTTVDFDSLGYTIARELRRG